MKLLIGIVMPHKLLTSISHMLPMHPQVQSDIMVLHSMHVWHILKVPLHAYFYHINPIVSYNDLVNYQIRKAKEIR